MALCPLRLDWMLVALVLALVVLQSGAAASVVLSDSGSDASKTTSAQSTTVSAAGYAVKIEKSSSQEQKNEHARMYTECTHILAQWKESCIAGCDHKSHECNCQSGHAPYRVCCFNCKSDCYQQHTKLLMDKCMSLLDFVIKCP